MRALFPDSTNRGNRRTRNPPRVTVWNRIVKRGVEQRLRPACGGGNVRKLARNTTILARSVTKPAIPVHRITYAMCLRPADRALAREAARDDGRLPTELGQVPRQRLETSGTRVRLRRRDRRHDDNPLQRHIPVNGGLVPPGHGNQRAEALREQRVQQPRDKPPEPNENTDRADGDRSHEPAAALQLTLAARTRLSPDWRMISQLSRGNGFVDQHPLPLYSQRPLRCPTLSVAIREWLST